MRADLERVFGLIDRVIIPDSQTQSVYPANIRNRHLINLSIDRFLQRASTDGTIARLLEEHNRGADLANVVTLNRANVLRRVQCRDEWRQDAWWTGWGHSCDPDYGFVLTDKDEYKSGQLDHGGVVGFVVKSMYQHPDFLGIVLPQEDELWADINVYSKGDVIIQLIQGAQDQPKNGFIRNMHWNRYLVDLVAEWAQYAGFPRVCGEMPDDAYKMDTIGKGRSNARYIGTYRKCGFARPVWDFGPHMKVFSTATPVAH